jgi:hypothetical protein
VLVVGVGRVAVVVEDVPAVVVVEGDVVVDVVVEGAAVVDVVVEAGQSGIGSWVHSFATQLSLVHGSRSLQIFATPRRQRPNPSGPTQRSAPLHRSPSSQSSSETQPSGGG